MNALLVLIAAALPSDSVLASSAAEEIIVTASRQPQEQNDIAASSTVLDKDMLQALNLPLTSDALRLVPGLAVATTGPAGSQTQIRIRGAEANHSLLFVDGIRFNDPAAGNEPRFELLTNDSLSRIEVVRGPQSSLWGSEAVGGVIALQTANPFDSKGLSATAEYGSFDTIRSSGQFSTQTGILGISGSAGWIGSDGIDSVGDHGERDGFQNRNAGLKAMVRPNETSEIGVVGHWINSKSDFDGFDPDTFLRADTGDSSKNEIWAVRSWARTALGSDHSWKISADISLLDSKNRNFLDAANLNRTSGKRFMVGGQLAKELSLGATNHVVTVAAEHQKEDFHARDQQFFGATNQDRSRTLTAFVGEWRAEWNEHLITDASVRNDRFSDFADATTFQANLLYRFAGGWAAHVGYGEGIAQPSFYDLFGFFPGSFVGNPDLTPESSKGWEAGLRWSNARSRIAVTGFSSRLHDEIVDVFDTATFESSTANADGTSRRKGIEVEASHAIGNKTYLSINYSFLDADEQKTAGTAKIREVRRPRHSANLAVTTRVGPVTMGGSLAYVGARRDTDFDFFPAKTVTLHDYALASLSLAWKVATPLEAYLRMENAFDADYQDAVGYHTAGRTIYAGLRLRLGD